MKKRLTRSNKLIRRLLIGFGAAARKAKVGHFRRQLAVEQHVARCQIAVHNVLCVQVRDAGRCAVGDAQLQQLGPVDAYLARLGPVERVRERALCAVGGHVGGVAVERRDAKELHQVAAWLHAKEQLGLASEARDLRNRVVVLQLFDGDNHAAPLGLAHLSEEARANHLAELHVFGPDRPRLGAGRAGEQRCVVVRGRSRVVATRRRALILNDEIRRRDVVRVVGRRRWLKAKRAHVIISLTLWRHVVWVHVLRAVLFVRHAKAVRVARRYKLALPSSAHLGVAQRVVAARLAADNHKRDNDRSEDAEETDDNHNGQCDIRQRVKYALLLQLAGLASPAATIPFMSFVAVASP